MVVGNDSDDSHFIGFPDRVATGDAAINGYQYFARFANGFNRLVQGSRSEAVTIVKTVRDKRMNICAVLTQNIGKQRCRRNAVGIVIPVNKNGSLLKYGIP
jgi:hypothetical protein